MIVTKDTFLSNKGKRTIIVIFAFTLLNVVSYIIDPYSSYWDFYFNRSLLTILAGLALSFIFCLLISESSKLTKKKQ